MEAVKNTHVAVVGALVDAGASAEGAVAELSGWKMDDLKQLLGHFGLSKQGKKQELQDRLKQRFSSETAG